MLRVDYRTSFLRAYLQHKDGDKAHIDAEAGMKLVKEARLSTADLAQAHGAKGIAYYVIYEASTKSEDLQQSKTEFAEAVRIDADHPASWKWKSYLAVYLGREPAKGNTKEEKLAAEATRLADGYRLCREAETTLEAKEKSEGLSDEEKVYLASIAKRRATFVDPGFPRIWVEQIKEQKEHPDRYLWLLAAAEKMVLNKDDPKQSREYLDEAKKIIPTLTEDQREAARTTGRTCRTVVALAGGRRASQRQPQKGQSLPRRREKNRLLDAGRAAVGLSRPGEADDAVGGCSPQPKKVPRARKVARRPRSTSTTPKKSSTAYLNRSAIPTEISSIESPSC